MATEVNAETVCSYCGAGGTVTPATISWKGRTFVIDVCELHSANFDTLASLGHEAPTKGRKSRAKAKGHTVTPIDG